MADQDEIRGDSVYQIELPVTETPSPVEKPVATKEQQKSGLMANIGRMFNQDVREEMPAYKDIEIRTWDGPDDPENPFNWSLRYKWLLTITVCFISILTGLPAGTYGSGNDWMEKEFNVQNDPFPNLYWATTSWNMGAAFWPLIFVPITEASGRMPGYFVAYVILVISLFPSAFAKNFATIVVTRFFGGGASSVSINIVGGSISDVWLGDHARSLPMSIFGFTSVVGIALDDHNSEESTFGRYLSTDIANSHIRTALQSGTATQDTQLAGIGTTKTGYIIRFKNTASAEMARANTEWLHKLGNNTRLVKPRFGFVVHRIPTKEFITSIERREIKKKRCFRCQRFGHLAWSYKETPRCEHCAGQYERERCPPGVRARCLDCSGEHPTGDRQCPTPSTSNPPYHMLEKNLPLRLSPASSYSSTFTITIT
ncbi:Major facilitator superfamily domain, general substrate transporter [Penicillium italicum]|uniref:Major facilitator superfamily domain, general substrate transporter n=1 Tax=Penicillium italicum TaxID=40296 RepID=A0A0A2KRH1_PENIT|nr:Major facilitator superfamily domain, general substrate transporter [Penicillium italicum]